MKSRQSRRLLALTAMMCGGMFGSLAFGMEDQDNDKAKMLYPGEFDNNTTNDQTTMTATVINVNDESIVGKDTILQYLKDMNGHELKDALDNLRSNNIDAAFIRNINAICGVICIYKNDSGQADIGVVTKTHNGFDFTHYLEYCKNGYGKDDKISYIYVDIDYISDRLKKMKNIFGNEIAKPSPLLWMYFIGVLKDSKKFDNVYIDAVKRYVSNYYDVSKLNGEISSNFYCYPYNVENSDTLQVYILDVDYESK